jgi:hypothetical protein
MHLILWSSLHQFQGYSIFEFVFTSRLYKEPWNVYKKYVHSSIKIFIATDEHIVQGCTGDNMFSFTRFELRIQSAKSLQVSSGKKEKKK